MDIRFTESQRKYIAELIKDGDYKNAGEVVSDALRLHKRYKELMLEDLRAEIKAGWDGPDSKETISTILASRQKVK